MKTKFTALFAFIFVQILCTACNMVSDQSEKYKFIRSTAALVMMSATDKSENLCTAVAFAKSGEKYQLFTAAHCVADYKKETSETIFKKTALHLIFEKQSGGKVAYEAKVLAIGEMKNLEDFAVLEAEIGENIPIMPLSKSGPELNEDILVATTPSEFLSTGFFQFRGYVSREKMSNVTIFGNIETKDAFGMQINGLGSAGGTSGAGVFSVKRGAVVGIMIGSVANEIGNISLLVVPINKFNNFYLEFTEGKRPLGEAKNIEPKKGENPSQCVKPQK